MILITNTLKLISKRAICTFIDVIMAHNINRKNHEFMPEARPPFHTSSIHNISPSKKKAYSRGTGNIL